MTFGYGLGFRRRLRLLLTVLGTVWACAPRPAPPRAEPGSSAAAAPAASSSGAASVTPAPAPLAPNGVPPWLCRGTQLSDDSGSDASGPARPAPPSLPAFMTIDDARYWTRAEGRIDLATAERWPSYPLRWIVVVGSRATESAPLSLHVAVIEEGASVRVIATSTELAPRVQFSLLPADYWPGFCACDDGTDGWESVEIDAYLGLEFPAHHGDLIGVHGSSSEPYAGGGGTFTVLTLLRIDRDRLVPVLEVPSGALQVDSW